MASDGGDIVFASRGLPHTLANSSGAAARYLLVCTPAGFERYFGRLAAEQAGVEVPAWALQPTPEVVRVGPQISRDTADVERRYSDSPARTNPR